MVPDFEGLMLPLLGLHSDGQEHDIKTVVNELAALLKLTDADRKEILRSGHRKFNNRVGWARTYMKKAGLMESKGWGKQRITLRGLDVLKASPSCINVTFLKQFPEFVKFCSPTADTSGQVEPPKPPEEVLEQSYQALRHSLAEELLERVKAASPGFFERLVVDLLVAMGYGGSRIDAGEAVGKSGDEGIDGIIKEDKLGLDVIYVQAKRWDKTVGGPVVQTFAGSLEGQKAKKGVFITTSQFSPDAKRYVTKIEKRIVLIDGERLAQLMIDHEIGVANVATYSIKRIDADYFAEE